MATGTSPIIIGLYGLPGVGKTTLLSFLKTNLPEDSFLFFEGSEMVAKAAGGSLSAFKAADEAAKREYRKGAMTGIAFRCSGSEKIGIVTGHYSFPTTSLDQPVTIFTEADMHQYTHIIYLSASGEEIRQRCSNDTRVRMPLTTAQIDNWTAHEIAGLKLDCYQNKILLCLPRIAHKSSTEVAEIVMPLIQRFQRPSEILSRQHVAVTVNEFISKQPTTLQRVLVFDGDKTLSDEDTTERLWRKSIDASGVVETPADIVFKLAGYTDYAFRQVAQSYRDMGQDCYDACCAHVATTTHVLPELHSILTHADRDESIAILIVTAGLRRPWEGILSRLLDDVHVIGNGPFDGPEIEYVVTADTKADIVRQFQDRGLEVWAFGDSPLDLPMLEKADRCVVVVGKACTRSQSMEWQLDMAIDRNALAGVRQLLSTPFDHTECPPRLDTDKLPLVNSWDIISSLNDSAPRFRLHHATNKASSKLLRTPTRDAAYHGPSLRDAHQQIGRYLATEYVSHVLGLAECAITNVHGKQDVGHRLQHGEQTIIVPLMRGGEAMAMGVSDVFPAAMFLHAKNPVDLTTKHLDQCRAIVLVDSVVNSGASIAEFVTHIRGRARSVPIVVVAGVVQSDAVRPGGAIRRMALKHDVATVALRLSDNKFTGKGVTDTGARLFNTTVLE